MTDAYLILDKKLDSLNGSSSCFRDGSRDTAHQEIPNDDPHG